MAVPNEPLKPIPFEVAKPAPVRAPEPVPTARSGSANWVLPALAGLLLVAAAVIFWLPERVAGPIATTPAPEADATKMEGTGESGTTNSTAGKGSEATPWSDAQLARQRKEAQEVLAELLDLQFALEERGAGQWAAEPFAAAATQASAADALYKNRQYAEATAGFRAALDILKALETGIPALFNSLLEQARTALEQGDATAAGQALATAAAIEQGSPEVAQLEQRLAALPQVLVLLEQASTAESGGDLAQAEQLLQQATALDPEHAGARKDLKRVATALRGNRFNAAMSEGFAALDAGRFDSARRAFRSAASLQPGSAEATSALREVEAAATAQQLANLEQQGRQAEQQERWQDAVNSYEKAQKIDSSVVFASAGLERSNARAQLDKQFSSVLEQPERLADEKVANAAAALLLRAKTINPRGPVLAGQLQRLEKTLQLANTKVALTVHSDQQTEVTIYKVARLGRFEQQQLSLRPGRYTAVGSRNGYRDVRIQFTVSAESPPAPLYVICKDTI